MGSLVSKSGEATSPHASPALGTVVASVNVTELPSKRQLSINLPSEEGGDMMTMEKFLSLVKDKLSEECVIARLMVGDRQISKHTDLTRSVHYFLLDNCPWYVHAVSPEERPKELFVKSLLGKTITIFVCMGETIADIKQKIYDREGIPPDQQRIRFRDRELQDQEDTFEIPNQFTVYLLLRLRGGPGMPFVDVTDEAGPARLEWCEKAPDWRRASRGLCLEGKCTNRSCNAYSHMVIMGVGYKELDLINEGHLCECPICHKTVVPITCGFNNCMWKIIGRKMGKLGHPPQMFRSEWKSVKDHYERFSPDQSGTAHFLDLKILCKEYAGQTCAVCAAGTTHDRDTMKRAGCGHTFHSNGCFDLATDCNNCIECMANRNMTSYQKLFR